MENFKAGQQLKSRSICDSNCIFTAEVIKTTVKTVLIKVEGEEKRCKIHRHNGSTFIYPFGRYSMAPIFRA